MNLMLNAIEAMKDTAGELTIKTEMGQGDTVLISVSDTGVGLPNEKTEQIFNSFFTTKPQGSGMGYRSAAQLWNRMAAICGRRPTPDTARHSTSPCQQQRRQ
jgi:C4-dicarboxylate-specific signal transduction histidine kinase